LFLKKSFIRIRRERPKLQFERIINEISLKFPKVLAPQLYPVNEDFLKLKPRYHVTSVEMQGYFLSVISGEKVGQIRNKGKGSGKSPSL